MGVNEKRIRLLQAGIENKGPVVYWMSRDQRARDNWALLFAQQEALAKHRPLLVVFCLVPDFLGARGRQYSFMLAGLRETAVALSAKNIPFILRRGDPGEKIPALCRALAASMLVTDFDPLKIKRAWKASVMKAVAIPVWEVDAHNIVPCRIASPKQEYGAYTLRPKINRILDEFMEEFPRLRKMPVDESVSRNRIDWPDMAAAEIGSPDAGPGSIVIKPGTRAGMRVLGEFLENKYEGYSAKRNDPNADAVSGLSPYLHFGQISAQRVALEAEKRYALHPSTPVFMDELVVRRELSDNFCFYNAHYDGFDGFPEWARRTLLSRAHDKRDYLYSRSEFETARTHDLLWNAAQRGLVASGLMHGWVRMYWAKKILEWSASPRVAMRTAVYLNDTYALDGRDPNGYTGCAWAIGGVHDRAWGEREVFGKVRYMSLAGAKNKFDVRAYIKRQQS